MKKLKHLNAWYFALIFTILYSSFIFYLFATLHPAGTPFDFESYLFTLFAGLVTLLSIYYCYRLLRKKENIISIASFYSLLFIISLLIFPLVYGVYYGLIVTRMIYQGGASIDQIIKEVKIMFGVFHIPICFSIIVGLYNEKVFRLKHDIIEKENKLSETRLILLQQQVNPHFLFNNLNILSALIQQSPEQALKFTHKLSEIYRYHLRSEKKQIVSLRDEIEYMQDYIFLLSSRFGEAFQLDLKSNQLYELEETYIITGTLQILLENVVKHNKASLQEPLIVSARITNEILLIENRLNTKEAKSEGVGLKNLEYRYKILTGKEFTYGAANGVFSVKIPLIHKLKV